MPEETFVTSQLIVSNDAENLFIKLTPDVLAKLLSNCDTGETDGADPARWSLKNGHSQSFLPLAINLPGATVYASFNGGLLSEYTDTLQVPDGLLLDRPCDTTHARVRVLSSVEYATHVCVDPLHIEDWELMQVHADILEGGGLLSLVSLVYKGQKLRFRIPTLSNNRQKNDVISLVVRDISTSVDLGSSLWPTVGDASEDDIKPTYGLLRSDTEVVITPLTRTKKDMFDAYAWSQPMQVIPTIQDVGQEVLTALESVTPLLHSMQDVQVECIFIHPNSYHASAALNTPEWVEVRIVGTENTVHTGVMARVFFSAEVRESCAALHPWLRLNLGAALLWDHVVVRPCVTVIPISIDQVALYPIRFEYTKVISTWSTAEQRQYNRLFDPSAFDQLSCKAHLAIGSCIGIAGNRGAKGSPQYFRLTLKNSTKSGSPHMIVASREWKDLNQMANEIISRISSIVEVVDIPLTDRLITMARPPILTTTLEASVSLLMTLRREAHFFCILHGAAGTGKTHVVSLLGTVAAVDHGRALLYLDCKQLQQLTKTLSEILLELDTIFQRAATTSSCLIVLDDLDRIAPNLVCGNEGDPGSRAQGASPTAVDQSKVVADRILQLYAAVNMERGSVSVVATCSNDTSLHVSLFSDEVAVGMGMPDFKDRLTLFSHFLRSDRLSTKEASDLSESTFGQPTEGFRPRDIEKLAARTKRLMEGTTSGLPRNTVHGAVIAAIQGYTPLSHIGLERPRSIAGLSWCEIGGLFTVKKKLETILLDPVKYRAIFQQAKIRLPRGILLLGPTGCGKSCIVPALAELCKFPLISCKGPEVLDKYIGASEAKVRELFQRAAAVAPSILFLDEMDALAPRRGSDHTGVTDRVVNQILTFLDGVEDSSCATVYVIAASSRPDKIDPALLRPGRLEQHLYIGPPETDPEWLDLVRKTMVGWKLSIPCREFVVSEAGGRDLLTMVRKQPLLCPADVKAAMDTAQLNAVHRTLRNCKPQDVNHVEIEVEDLIPAFMSLQPCLNPDDARMLVSVYDRYRPDRERSMRPRDISQAPLKTTLR